MLKKQNILLFIINLLILTLVFSKAASASNPARVLILPFTIHSEKDLSFLQNGIEDMLSTRLALEGKVVPLSREETEGALKDLPERINIHSAISLGERLQADYVLFGSLTVFGNSISTDARFVDIAQKKPVVIFNQSGKTHDDVIAHIDAFAAQINEKVFGRKTYSLQSFPQKKITVPESRRNPEAIWAKENMINAGVSYDVRGTAPSISFPLWKSRKFKIQIKGMSVGDVDGDNKNEAVFISKNKIFVYRKVAGRFVKVAEIDGKSNSNFLGVDVGDINKNGKAEIFVTNLSSTSNRLKSFVLEWNGTEFAKTADNTKWYYRILNIPTRGGNLLLGQKKGSKDIFSHTGVYELKWSNGRYKPAGQPILPKRLNIYGFTFGDVLNNGQEMIVAFTDNDRIRILDKAGKEEWKSSEPFGGGAITIEFPSKVEKNETDRIYLPQRLYVTDTDKDGKNEIIVVKNTDAARGLLPRFKVYKNGQIECLALDELGFTLKWKTRKFSGLISDYTIADLNNDGQKELVFSIITKKASIFGKAKSFIVSQQIKL